MKITEFIHKGVSKDGKVKGGGAVTPVPLIRMSAGEGCGAPGCSCSRGYWITIVLGLHKGTVRGLQAKFDSKEEFEEFLETHELKGRV